MMDDEQLHRLNREVKNELLAVIMGWQYVREINVGSAYQGDDRVFKTRSHWKSPDGKKHNVLPDLFGRAK